MKLTQIISNLKEKRDKVLNGGVNCIPVPFARFRRELTGVQQGKYYLVSASTKVGKTQITNYLFIYNTLLYAYYNPDVIKPKILYFPLEETEEAITLRFIAFLINHITKGKTRISPNDLKSLDERQPLSDEIIDIMESEEFKNIYELFEESVTFYDVKNPYGIYKAIKDYVLSVGKVYYKDITIKVKDEWNNINKDTVVKQFDRYIPDNPDEYVIPIVDHIGIIDPEKGMTKYEAINQLSAYMVELRNKYNVSPVVVQQQNQETSNLTALQQNKIRPTIDGLRDSKQTSHDCNVFLGLTSPYRYEISNYMNYNITLFKDRIRFLELIFDRDGNSNSLCPLYFEGDICNFKELPKASDTEEMSYIYTKLKRLDEMKAITDKVIKSTLFLKLGQWFQRLYS